MQVNILEAKNRLSELIKAVQSGQQVVIANRGQPVVQLVVAPSSALRHPAGDINRWLAATPLPAHARRTAQEIEADLAMERSAWD